MNTHTDVCTDTENLCAQLKKWADSGSFQKEFRFRNSAISVSIDPLLLPWQIQIKSLDDANLAAYLGPRALSDPDKAAEIIEDALNNLQLEPIRSSWIWKNWLLKLKSSAAFVLWYTLMTTIFWILVRQSVMPHIAKPEMFTSYTFEFISVLVALGTTLIVWMIIQTALPFFHSALYQACSPVSAVRAAFENVDPPLRILCDEKEVLSAQLKEWANNGCFQKELQIEGPPTPVIIDPILRLGHGQVRQAKGAYGMAMEAIYLGPETAKDKEMTAAIIEHEKVHVQLGLNRPYTLVKNWLLHPKFSPLFMCWYALGTVMVMFHLRRTVLVDLVSPEVFASSGIEYLSLAAVLGAALILWCLIHILISYLYSCLSRFEELLADRGAVKAGYKNDLLRSIANCEARWWQPLRTHPTFAVRRFFAEKVWKPSNQRKLENRE